MSDGGSPTTNLRTDSGPHIGWPHCAVGMHRARHSAMGQPSNSTSADRMLRLVMPPDVSKSFKDASTVRARLRVSPRAWVRESPASQR